MKRILVCVRDRACDTYGAPFCVTALGQATRSFADEINRPATDNQLYQHPEDFDLYELGTFDDSTGLFDVGVPRQIAVGKDVVVREEKPMLRAVN